MKNLKIILVLSTVLFINSNMLFGQKKDSLMYRAYLLSSENLWKSALDQYTKDMSLEKAIAYYGILNNTMVSFDEETFDEFVDPALEYLEALEEKEINKAEAMALRSSIYGFIMAYSPWKGMYYGPKSTSAIESALKINSESAIVNMISGSSLFYTPEAFGGDKQAAAKAFQKAVNLFEEHNYRGWLYINTLANLGKTYHALGQNQKAIDIYKKALDVEPNFKWVSYQLLPQAKKSK